MVILLHFNARFLIQVTVLVDVEQVVARDRARVLLQLIRLLLLQEALLLFIRE